MLFTSLPLYPLQTDKKVDVLLLTNLTATPPWDSKCTCTIDVYNVFILTVIVWWQPVEDPATGQRAELSFNFKITPFRDQASHNCNPPIWMQPTKLKAFDFHYVHCLNLIYSCLVPHRIVVRFDFCYKKVQFQRQEMLAQKPHLPLFSTFGQLFAAVAPYLLWVGMLENSNESMKRSRNGHCLLTFLMSGMEINPANMVGIHGCPCFQSFSNWLHFPPICSALPLHWNECSGTIRWLRKLHNTLVSYVILSQGTARCITVFLGRWTAAG